MASFNDAFRSARAGGKKSFSWQGKTYSTELAKTGKAPSSVPVPTRSPAKTSAPAAKSVSDVAKKSSPGMKSYMADKGYKTGAPSGPTSRSAGNKPKGYMADAGPARTKGGQSDARKMPTRKG
jgi:hypothetical protein